MPRGSLPARCCAALLLLGARGQAEPSSPAGADWSWSIEPGLSGCASESEIRQRVEAQVRASDRSAGDGKFQEAVIVELSRREGVYRAWIAVQPPGGRRRDRELTSEGHGCRELDEALVLSLTLLLTQVRRDSADGGDDGHDGHDGASTVVDTLAPLHESDAGEVMNVPPSGASPESDARTGTSRREVGGRLGVGPAASLGQVPGVGLGGLLAMRVPVASAWSVSGGASYLGARHAQQGNARFAFSATEAWLGAIHRAAGTAAWRLDLEAALLVGWLHAIPKSLDPSDPGDSAFAGLRVGASVGRALSSKVGLSFGVAGHLLANTWRFYVRDVEDPVWAQPRAGVRLEMLLTWGDL